MDRRTEDQKVRGVVPLTWGGSVREVPTLKRAAARLWRASLASALVEVGAVEIGQIQALAVAGDVALDRMVLLIRAYDHSGILGTPEWIEEHVDDAEVYAAFRVLLELAYPFVTDLRGVLGEVQRLGLMAGNLSRPQDSTNGPSPDGDSLPMPSMTASTTPS